MPGMTPFIRLIPLGGILTQVGEVMVITLLILPGTLLRILTTEVLGTITFGTTGLPTIFKS